MKLFKTDYNALWCIRKPAVIMIVGVNGGGKTTSLGKAIDIAFGIARERYYYV